jgi:Tfp pilus assembly protein PilV
MDERGFSLVETVVAALVLAVGVLALVGADGAASRLAGAAQRREHAVEEAASTLDKATCPSPPSRLSSAVTAQALVPVTGQRTVTVQRYLFCAAAP